MGDSERPWEDVEIFDYEEVGDYYDDLMTKESKRLKELKGSLLSSAWSRGRLKSNEAERVVYDLLQIRDVVASLIKIHGVLPKTSVGVASIRDVCSGLGASGFTDTMDFLGPYILLDKGVYEDCNSHDMLDVYCGIGLHEASHINHTRQLFKRLESGRLSNIRRIWENLFEDTRIEEKVREESPGYGPYIQAVKVKFLMKKEANVDFKKLSDFDKICFLIFCFVRVPEIMTDEMKEWKDIKSRCIYDALREMFPAIPDTEEDVQEYAERLEKFFGKEKETYEDLATKPTDEALEEIREARGGEGKSDSKSSMEDYKKLSDFKKDSADDDRYKSAKKKLKEEQQRAKDSVSETGLKEDSEGAKKRELFGAVLEELKRREEKLRKSREGKRFSVVEIEKLVERLSKIEGLSSEESDALERATEERLEFAEQWKYSEYDAGDTPDRRTIIIHPKPTKEMREKYERGKKLVRGSVNRMRGVFRLRLGTRHYLETELTEGRLHRRMLGRAPVSERLFSRSYTRTDQGVAIALVLDESGSMGGCDDSFAYETRATVAQKIAILIAEALRGLSGIELEIYSYGSCGTSDRDCLIKYLYGKENPDIVSLAGYTGSYQNYDHIAIKICGDLFIRNTTNTNRVMLVMSDGAPAGYDYGGHKAEVATKKSVEDLEKKGVTVINIAINAYKSETMFRHVLKFLDLNDLINRMRRLIVSVVRSVS